MDDGHFNCRDYRDYHAPPKRAPFYRSPFERHESFDELEQRSRSPASTKPKFPLLQLPLELRQQIFKYLLPRTIEHTEPNPLANHARNFSAVKKRGARGMIIPQAQDPLQKGQSNIVWQRGNISLLSVSRQIYDECASLLYGTNTFLLFITYSAITFRFSWLLPSGLKPNRAYNFLEQIGKKYHVLIRRLVVTIDNVDSYTSMIKFNVSGSGLTHGLRQQVQRLVGRLQAAPPSHDTEVPESRLNRISLLDEERRLARITIRVINGNPYLDHAKSEVVKQREGGIRMAEDIQEMLQPFAQLRGVRAVNITGAVTATFASDLAKQMRSTDCLDEETMLKYSLSDLDLAAPPQICCYGNDI